MSSEPQELSEQLKAAQEEIQRLTGWAETGWTAAERHMRRAEAAEQQLTEARAFIEEETRISNERFEQIQEQQREIGALKATLTEARAEIARLHAKGDH